MRTATTPNTHELVFALAAALLQPRRVLKANDVTAGAGIVIDWRHLKSGIELIRGADAFDTARVFLTAVGWSAAAQALEEDL